MKKTIIILAVVLLAGGGYAWISSKGKIDTKYKTTEPAFPINNDGKIQNAGDNSSLSTQPSSIIKTSSSRTVPVSGQAKPPVTDTASINNLSKLESDLGMGIDSQNVSGATVDESIEFELGL